tara:strand:+ start:8773 stop:9477 length:705 start_codon:yes stop_codon:yes gene_type:complete
MIKKKVLVIGGTSGYGLGIVDVLNKKGFNAIPLGTTSMPKVDVTDTYSIEELFKTQKNIDSIVYASGIAIGKNYVSEKSVVDMEKVIQVNTIGLLKALKYSYKYLLKSKGNFIYIGSIASELSYVGGADYCASKSASTTIMKTIRKEWLGTGIRTCTIEAGLGNTDFQKRRYNGDFEKAKKHSQGIKLIQPEDMGNLVYSIMKLPNHLNMDEVIFKPLDQASHGISVNNLKTQF